MYLTATYSWRGLLTSSCTCKYIPTLCKSFLKDAQSLVGCSACSQHTDQCGFGQICPLLILSHQLCGLRSEVAFDKLVIIHSSPRRPQMTPLFCTHLYPQITYYRIFSASSLGALCIHKRRLEHYVSDLSRKWLIFLRNPTMRQIMRFGTCQVCWGCRIVLIAVMYWGTMHEFTVILETRVIFFQKSSDLSRKWLIFLRNHTQMQIMCFRMCQVCWGCHIVLIEVKHRGPTHRSIVISSRHVSFFRKMQICLESDPFS